MISLPSLLSQACDCLKELELTYPHLLTKSLGHIFSFCQTEYTHASQSYHSLLSTIFFNTTSILFEEQASSQSHLTQQQKNEREKDKKEKEREKLIGSLVSTNILSTTVDLCPYTIPLNVHYQGPLQSLIWFSSTSTSSTTQIPDRYLKGTATTKLNNIPSCIFSRHINSSLFFCCYKLNWSAIFFFLKM